MRTLFLFALLTVVLRAESDDPSMKGPGLKIELIAETASMTPGKPLTVGVHIKHFPGFHTYWKNPGMVGMETSLKWKLPKGFTASEIHWPAPENTFMGQYPCHGYERDVTLLVTITPPESLSGNSVTLSTEAGWMCCAKGCFPGFQTLSLTLPVREKPVPAPNHAKLIARAKKDLPSTDHGLTATLLSKVDAPVVRIHFTSKSELPLKDLYFFSTDRQISSDQIQKFEPQPDGSLILNVARSEFSPEEKTSLPGVLRIGKAYYSLVAQPSK
ncbi:MAG: protein-disulfide reductase DsbD domain-containing protein [Akkermansiaceae bacterium]